MILFIILIYIIGVFAAIAVVTGTMKDCVEEDVRNFTFFSIFSWLYVVAVLLLYIIYFAWNYVVKYPFVWFYNKCNKKFRKKKNEKSY